MKETKTKKKMHKLNELFEEKRGQRIRLQQLSIKGEKYKIIYNCFIKYCKLWKLFKDCS